MATAPDVMQRRASASYVAVSPDARDADAMLNVLLERLDVALVDIRADVNGMPLFAVEAKLAHRLRVVLPGVKFTAQDIRTWSAEISS